MILITKENTQESWLGGQLSECAAWFPDMDLPQLSWTWLIKQIADILLFSCKTVVVTLVFV